MPLPDCLVRCVPLATSSMTPSTNLWQASPQRPTASIPKRIPLTSPSPTILIVEDDLDNAFLARYISEEAGYVPHSASSGADALKMLNRQTFTLLLLDIVLPDMDGFRILEAIHQQRPTTTMPIIAVTAMAYQWQQHDILNAGFDDYLCKPYSVEAMEAMLLKYHPCNRMVHP